MNAQPSTGRSYDNTSRAAQARATQRRVVQAAQELLLERGYAGTTITDVAQRAGVSAETVYKHFGNKAALTKRVYDIALVGDDEPIPFAERPEVHAIAVETDPHRKIELYAAVARQLSERLGPLLAVLYGARATDAELDAFADTINNERLIGVSIFINHLVDSVAMRSDLDPVRARDMVWTLLSPEVYLLLVHERGWTTVEYERWLANSIASTLLP